MPALTRRLTAPATLAALCLAATSVQAALAVRFIEGAPKDRFEIVNRAACDLTAADVVIDLTTSRGGLVFDPTDRGAGVEVFQPFELVAGADALSGHSPVNDGDRQVTLSVRRLAPGARIAFTIDVDDTLGPRGITVAGSEIEGAQLRLSSAAGVREARFDAAGTATVRGAPACP